VEIVVSGERRPEVPVSTSVVDPELVAHPSGMAPTEALVAVPGVLVQNRENPAQDVRIDVRGFGTRSAFGMRGIRVVLDGIPLTLPDGQTALDAMALTDLHRIEVVRGPASVVHGSTPGGALVLSTEPPAARPEFRLRTRAGAFETVAVRSVASGQVGVRAEAEPSARTLGYRLSASSFSTGGYRDHSSAKTEAAQLRLKYSVSPLTVLSLVTDVSTSPWLEDPGGLTRDEFRRNPRAAAPSSEVFSTGERVTQLRSGLVLGSALTRRERLDGAVYLNARRFNALRPERAIELARTHPGASLRFTTTRPVRNMPSQLTLAVDAQEQRDVRVNWSSEPRQPKRSVVLDQEERVLSFGASSYGLLNPLEPVTVMGGLRGQLDRYVLEDHLPQGGDASGNLSFASVSALGGVGWNFDVGTAFLNVGRSVENPTLTELTNRPTEQSGLNTDVGPVSATSYETGVRLRVVPPLQPELSVFRIELRDELVPYQDASQRVYFRNAGRSHRDGLEATLGVRHERLAARSTYSYLRAEFDRYSGDGVDRSGNEVPGIPRHRWANTVRYGGTDGLLVGLDVVWYSGAYVNDANRERSPATVATSALFGYSVSSERWHIAFEGRLQNLLDRQQLDNVRVNANGGRYYESAPGFIAWGGLELRYLPSRESP
jgi:iron complex outermembrane receptor protein